MTSEATAMAEGIIVGSANLEAIRIRIKTSGGDQARQAEKRKKVNDREGLIDQLWLAIEALPDPEPPSDAKRLSKQDA